MQETWVQSLDREDPLKKRGTPLQYSCLENAMDRGAWQATPWGRKEWDTIEQLTLSFHV